MAYASMNLVCSFNLHCVEKGKKTLNYFLFCIGQII